MSNKNTQEITDLVNLGDKEVIMSELYEGIVLHVGENSAVVVYEIGEDIVEHTYYRAQFKGSILPEVGTRIGIYVRVVRLPLISQREDISDEEAANKVREGRKNILRGQVEF